MARWGKMRIMRRNSLVRTGHVAVAMAMVGAASSAAQAQTFNVNTPVSVPVAGNVDRFQILPVITTTYDSNALRANGDAVEGPRDNVRVSPGASVILNRLIGRTRFSLNGTAGYDFNTRFTEFNRERINLASQVTTPVGSPCTVTGNAGYERAQFDLTDTGVLVGASYQRQTYDVSASCSRVAGLYPAVGANYVSTSNSSSSSLDSNQFGLRAGVGYARPSLGNIRLEGGVSKISRPGVKDVLGIDDSRTISYVQFIFSRAVAPRVSFNLGAGLAHANPARTNVKPFTGPSFNGQLTIRPIPRVSFVAAAQRNVQNQSGYSATYVILDTYRVAGSYRLSSRSRASIYGQRSRSDPRGQDLLQFVQPRGADTLRVLGADYSFDFPTSLRLTLSLQRLKRTAGNSIYDYEASTASAGVSARF
jgi:hypothetical protein